VLLPRRWALRCGGVLIALFGMAPAIGGLTAPDDARRTLTVYAAECPAGYAGNASSDECDDNPAAGVSFRIGRPFTEAFTDYVPTDGEGLVYFGFAGLPLDGTLRMIEELPANTEHFVAFCVDELGTPLSITYADYSEGNPSIGVADVAVGEAGDVACDWYNVPGLAETGGTTVAQMTDDPNLVSPTVVALKTRVAEQEATIEAMESALARSAAVGVAEPAEDYSASGVLPSPVMAGELGDEWELDLADDSFWWIAAEYGWVDAPSPRYVAEPHGVWMVVSIDLGTEEGFVSNGFPYETFALEDHLGNVYYADLTATDAYCDLYCDMDVVQQDFSGWRSHKFHQAVVFDVPAPGDDFSGDDPGFTLRTVDGLVAVPLRR